MPEDERSEITDNVIMGDFTHVANKVESGLRVTCESCHASGNFTIFVCNNTNCTNKFCEHCKDSVRPKKCTICNKELAEKEEARVLAGKQAANAAADEDPFTKSEGRDLKRREKKDVEEDSDYVDDEWDYERWRKYNSTLARLYRLRLIIWPLVYLFSLSFLYVFMSIKWGYNTGLFLFGILLVHASLSALVAGAIFSVFDFFDIDSIDAEYGYAPLFAALVFLSPVISSAFIYFITKSDYTSFGVLVAIVPLILGPGIVIWWLKLR